MRHRAAVPLLLTLTLLAAMGFHWAPMALRWPLRILMVMAVALASLIGARQICRAGREDRARALVTVLAPFLLLGGAGLVLWNLRSDQMVGRISALDRELSRRGIELAVLALPSFESMFPTKHEVNDLPLPVEEMLVGEALERISEAGVATGDLNELFDDYVNDPTMWQEDELHLTEEGIGRLSDPLIEYFNELGWGPGAGMDRKIVLVGNCFAGQFAETIRDRLPGWRSLRGLTVRGDKGQAPDSLFLFPEEYLDGTEMVIWVMPYATLLRSGLPELNFSPDLGAAELKTATIRVITGLEWSAEERKARLAAMPYPNGIVTLTGGVLASDDFPRGERLVVLGYGVSDRELTPLGLIGSGKRIAANLIPLDYFLSRHPNAASEFRLNDDADVTADRYWIHSWTSIR